MNNDEMNMEWFYWKVVVRYGHVGKKKEISVARYLVMPEHSTMIDLLNIINEIPGAKNRAVLSLRKVDRRIPRRTSC